MSVRLATVCAALSVLFACAKPDVQEPVRSNDDFLYPAWEAGDVRPEEGRAIEQAWADVMSGRTTRASKRMRELLRKRPSLVSAEAVLGYAALRVGDLAEATRWFDAAIGHRPGYVPALVGLAVTASRRGEDEVALGHAEQALAGGPGDPALSRRVATLKLRVVEERTVAARDATARGDAEAAVEHLERALEVEPALAPLRLELAELLVEADRRSRAISVLRAVPDDDSAVLLRLAGLLEEEGEPVEVMRVYRRLLEAHPGDEEVEQRSREVARRVEVGAATPEYWRIPTSARVTRADLAALVSLKVTALGRVEAGEPAVAVDISGSWAREHIIRVLSYGLMDVYPNHTFQPGAHVRRGELAHVAGGVLELLAGGPLPPMEIPDVSPRHRYYRGINRVLDAGLMSLRPGGAFEAWRLVNGAEAVGAIDGLARRVGP